MGSPVRLITNCFSPISGKPPRGSSLDTLDKFQNQNFDIESVRTSNHVSTVYHGESSSSRNQSYARNDSRSAQGYRGPCMCTTQLSTSCLRSCSRTGWFLVEILLNPRTMKANVGFRSDDAKEQFPVHISTYVSKDDGTFRWV